MVVLRALAERPTVRRLEAFAAVVAEVLASVSLVRAVRSAPSFVTGACGLSVGVDAARAMRTAESRAFVAFATRAAVLGRAAKERPRIFGSKGNDIGEV